jgi:hypothetical protein
MDDYLGYQSASQVKRQNEQRSAMSGVESVGYSRVKRTPTRLGKIKNYAQQGFGILMRAGDNLAAHPELFDEQRQTRRKAQRPTRRKAQRPIRRVSRPRPPRNTGGMFDNVVDVGRFI